MGPRTAKIRMSDGDLRDQIRDDPAVPELNLLDLERPQRLGDREAKQPQRLAERRIADQLGLVVADDVRIQVVLAQVLVVQEMVLAEGDRARNRQREVTDNTQSLVVARFLEHEVVGALVDQDVERVVQEGAEKIGRDHDPEPAEHRREAGGQELRGHDGDHPERGPGVAHHQGLDLGMLGQNLPAPLKMGRGAVAVGEIAAHGRFSGLGFTLGRWAGQPSPMW